MIWGGGENRTFYISKIILWTPEQRFKTHKIERNGISIQTIYKE
jgi:hypothetical protein